MQENNATTEFEKDTEKGIDLIIKIRNCDGGFIKYLTIHDLKGNQIDKFNCWSNEELINSINKSIPDLMKKPFRPLRESSLQK